MGVVVFGLSSHQHAWSEDFTAAQDRLAQGYNRFFDAVYKGPTSTDASVSGFYKDHVAGPSRAAQHAQVQTSMDVMRSLGVKVVKGESLSREPLDPDGGDISWFAWDKEGSGKKQQSERAPAQVGADSGYASGVVAPVAPAATQPALEPVVIDGSEVPRELEFPGPKKK